MDVEKHYFEWLCSWVNSPDTGKTYHMVCDRMHQINFNWSVANDDNRAAEGKELRLLFMERARINDPGDRYILVNKEASLLEVLVALCQRADFMAEIGMINWFETMLRNLKLDYYYDLVCQPGDLFKITRILNRMNDRKYLRNGEGGLFPLRHASGHQKRIELWYQLAAFIHENHMF